ncbi:hypothetical protein KA344_01635 [bacterium]|nr:hypothetical protein [bacterium]
MKRINSKNLSIFTTTILSLSIFTIASTSSAMAIGPMTLNSVGAPPAKLVSSQESSTIASEQKSEQTKVTTKSTAQSSTYQGVNPGGSVRQNNLRQTEEAINLAANAGAVCALLFGAYLFFTAFGNNLPNKNKRVGRAIIGITILLFGLALPGSVNWLEATSHDTAIFN